MKLHEFKKQLLEKKSDTKVSGQGTQAFVGAVSETIAAGALIHHHLHPKHAKSDLNQDTMKKVKASYEAAAGKLDPEDLENRRQHGHEQAKRIKSHMDEMYPDHEMSEVHHTNIDGAIERATKGKHKDSGLVNPSDLTVGLKHKKTGETIYHGISLKSTKGKGDIGFKNPSPKHMDENLGTDTIGHWKEAHDVLNKHINKLHPGFSTLTNDHKKEVIRKLSGNRINTDKSKAVMNKAEHVKFHEDYNKIKDKTHAKIRDHIVDSLTKTINSSPEGHEKVKKFLLNNYLNASKDENKEGEAPPMPYSKVTTNGTAKSGVTSKVELPHESKVANILRDPEARLEVSRAPTGNKYIHYHAHVPQKDANGAITGHKRVHLFSEQVKTSSAFGNSSPRHNIQPPGKEKLEESNELSQSCGAGMYWCNTDKKCKPMPKEDAPTMSAGTGAVAGIGVGAQGEPGIKKKRVSGLISFISRKGPKLT